MQDNVKPLPSAGQGLVGRARTRDYADVAVQTAVSFGGGGDLPEVVPSPRKACIAWTAASNASASARRTKLAETRLRTTAFRIDACYSQRFVAQVDAQIASQDEWEDLLRRSEQTIKETMQHCEDAKHWAAEVQRLSTETSQFAQQCREAAAVGCSSSQAAVSHADAEAARAAETAKPAADLLEAAVKEALAIKAGGDALETAYARFREHQTQISMTLLQHSTQATGPAASGQPGSSCSTAEDKANLRKSLLITSQAPGTNGCLQAAFAWLSRIFRPSAHRNGQTTAYKSTGLDAAAMQFIKSHDG